MTRLLSDADFAVPASERYLEHYVPGAVYRYGTVPVTADAIVEFAGHYDPQPFHLENNPSGAFGGLIASGWQTASLMMRVLVDHVISSVASLGSPGCDELRWSQPVRPGDELSVRFEVLEARRSRSKADRGVVRAQITVLNQRDEPVMSILVAMLLLVRPEKTLD